MCVLGVCLVAMRSCLLGVGRSRQAVFDGWRKRARNEPSFERIGQEPSPSGVDVISIGGFVGRKRRVRFCSYNWIMRFRHASRRDAGYRFGSSIRGPWAPGCRNAPKELRPGGTHGLVIPATPVTPIV